MLQSRFTVRTEIPRTSPVSSSLRSPKGTTPGLHAFDHGELVRGLFAHKRTPRARIIGAQFARNRPRRSPNRFRSAQLLPSLLAIIRSILRSPLDMWSKSLSSFFAGFVRLFCLGNLAAVGSPELWNRS